MSLISAGSLKNNMFQKIQENLKAFTLIEMLISVTIFILTITTVLTIFTFSLKRNKEFIGKQSEIDAGRLIFEEISRELHSAKINDSIDRSSSICPPLNTVFDISEGKKAISFILNDKCVKYKLGTYGGNNNVLLREEEKAVDGTSHSLMPISDYKNLEISDLVFDINSDDEYLVNLKISVKAKGEPDSKSFNYQNSIKSSRSQVVKKNYLKYWSDFNDVYDSAKKDNYVYLATDNGLKVFDVSDPTNILSVSIPEEIDREWYQTDRDDFKTGQFIDTEYELSGPATNVLIKHDALFHAQTESPQRAVDKYDYAGGNHTCVLKNDNNIHCWGDPSNNQSDDYNGGNAIGISAGANHNCALLNNGSVHCWGDDTLSQAGDHTPSSGSFIAVSAGTTHSCALLNNGNVSCWGDNSYGKANAYTGGDAIGISVGESNSCALLSNGNVHCWGSNSNGQSAGYTVTGGVLALAVSVGNNYACALKSNGDVDCWGDNTGGKRAGFHANEDALALSVGKLFACVLDELGQVKCWGNSPGNYLTRDAITLSVGDEGVGGGHVCALLENGNLHCWGDNSRNQSTDYTNGDVELYYPADIYHYHSSADYVSRIFDTISNTEFLVSSWTDILVPGGFGSSSVTIKIRTSNDKDMLTAPAWTSCSNIANNTDISANSCVNDGDRYIQYKVNFATSNDRFTPKINNFSLKYKHKTFPKKLKFKNNYLYSINSAGGTNQEISVLDLSNLSNITEVAFFDKSLFGNFEDFDITGDNLFTVGQKKEISKIFSRNNNVCYLLKNNNVFCQGDLLFGGSIPLFSDYTLKDAIDVATSRYHTCVLNKSGNVICLGDFNSHGESDPYFGSDAIAISVGESHTCALLNNGNVHCWGRNYGSSSTGYTNDNYNGGDAIGVSSGDKHNCVLLNNGNVHCWGQKWPVNSSTGYTTDDYSPGSGVNTIKIVSARYHNCALLDNGNVHCWGQDNGGQVNDYLNGDAVDVATGEAHSCVIKSNKNIYCWGTNAHGEINDANGKSADQISAGNEKTCRIYNVIPFHGPSFVAVDCYGKDPSSYSPSSFLQFADISQPDNVNMYKYDDIDPWTANQKGNLGFFHSKIKIDPNDTTKVYIVSADYESTWGISNWYGIGGVYSFDVSDPSNINFLNFLTLFPSPEPLVAGGFDYLNDIKIDGDKLFSISNYNFSSNSSFNGKGTYLAVIDITNPNNMLASTEKTLFADESGKSALKNGFIYVPTYNSIVKYDSTNDKEIFLYNVLGAGQGIRFVDDQNILMFGKGKTNTVNELSLMPSLIKVSEEINSVTGTLFHDHEICKVNGDIDHYVYELDTDSHCLIFDIDNNRLVKKYDNNGPMLTHFDISESFTYAYNAKNYLLLFNNQGDYNVYDVTDRTGLSSVDSGTTDYLNFGLIYDNYLYASLGPLGASDGGLNVYDLTELDTNSNLDLIYSRNYSSVFTYYLAIDKKNKRLYQQAWDNGSGKGLLIYDISDPTSIGIPIFKGGFDTGSIAVKNGLLYTTANGIKVYDMSTPTNPVLIKSSTDSRLSGSTYNAKIIGDYLLVDAEPEGGGFDPNTEGVCKNFAKSYLIDLNTLTIKEVYDGGMGDVIGDYVYRKVDTNKIEVLKLLEKGEIKEK